MKFQSAWNTVSIHETVTEYISFVSTKAFL